MNPYRMLGRFDYAVDILMRKYHMRFAAGVPDWEELLLALSARVNPYDHDFCMRMAEKVKICLAQTEELSLNEFEIDDQKAAGWHDAEFLFRVAPDRVADLLLSERDYYREMEAEKETMRREDRRSNYLTFAAIAALFIGMVCFSFVLWHR